MSSDEPERITVYISIGNSDDKLTQARWAVYYSHVAGTINMHAYQQHGRWLSVPSDPYQNACWCIEVETRRVDRLRRKLAEHAATFGQDSIAWAEARTEFIGPAT